MTVFIPAIYCDDDLTYKTEREIELEKKLEIAVQALEKYANSFNWCDCKIKLGIDGFGLKSQEITVTKACYETDGFTSAQEALAKIKEIKE